MSARRKLDFSTPSSKRRRSQSTNLVVYRGVKPEMKCADFPISHSAVTLSNLHMTNLAQGTDIFQRIGNKVKVWRIEGIVRANVPTRIQILAPNSAGTAPNNPPDSLFNYRTDRVLSEYVFDAQVSNSYKHVNYKLPLGQVAIYTGPAGTNVSKGSIYVRLLTGVSTTLAGEFRVYYTDN